MKSAKLLSGLIAAVPFIIFQGCGGGGGGGGGSANSAPPPAGNAAANVMTVSVNGSLCSPATSGGYFNKPCVSVTVCTPGTANCQTVNDVLLDTGSFGLRIFRGAISNLSLPQVASGSGSLTGCIEFADGSSLWGPIQRAAVKLGNEPAVTVPIQVIDATFASPVGTNCAVVSPSPYVGPDRTAAEAGFTAILGVGVAPYDCGEACVSQPLGVYFRCVGSSCAPTTVPLADQVRNPATALPVDNNGLILQLPSVSLGGVASTSGTLLLGIGTEANNSPGSTHVIQTDSSGDFVTLFNGTSFSNSFLDTGSNAYYIPPTAAPTNLPRCPGNDSEWYCPATTTPFSAKVGRVNGTPTLPVTFNIGNAQHLFGTSNEVFNDIAGTLPVGFDWGLPFFLGRKVLYGFDGRSTPSLNANGPFVAF